MDDRELLARSCRRLSRLVELNSPASIVVNELRILNDLALKAIGNLRSRDFQRWKERLTKARVAMNDFDRGYFYDWTCEPPRTTDPKHYGKLRCGKHQRIILNGIAVYNIVKCVTGGKGVGWVEKNVWDEEGNPVYRECDGKMATERFYGEVEYICDE